MSEDLDSATIAALSAQGADLAQPRETIHYLYVPSNEAASRLASKVRRQGRTVDVRRMGREWAVVVKEKIVVNAQTISVTRHEMEAAAASFGGDYDGWEASLSQGFATFTTTVRSHRRAIIGP